MKNWLEDKIQWIKDLFGFVPQKDDPISVSDSNQSEPSQDGQNQSEPDRRKDKNDRPGGGDGRGIPNSYTGDGDVRTSLCFGSGVTTSDRDLTVFILLILFSNLFAGMLNLVWFPDEVASPLIIAGGSSAIFFLLFSKNDEERHLSLLFFVENNVIIFYLYQMPDPCCFLVVLFLIFVFCGHLLLWIDSRLFCHLLFMVVLTCRIFFHPEMAQWGLGLITELILISVFFILKKERSAKELSIFYLMPIFLIGFFNLLSFNYGIGEVFIQINFIFAAAALLFLVFFAQTRKELIICFFLYIFANISIGYLISQSIITFYIVTLSFLMTSLLFSIFFIIKAKRLKKTLSDMLLEKKREGIQTLLGLYFLVLGLLLKKCNPSSSTYEIWLMGLGIQIGFLTALKYFFQS